MDQSYDRTYLRQGINALCGIDEAGRGALAGPVVAAAVILPGDCLLPGVDDSKKLMPDKRIELAEMIRENALAIGIGRAEAGEIDRLNILQATFLAMQRAVDELQIAPHYCLIDGRDFPLIFYKNDKTPLRGRAVIKGDGLSQSIAAASIIAKTYRDFLMIRMASQYGDYGFAGHKGYGTERHRRNLLSLGPCPEHRRSFLKKLAASARLTETWMDS